MPRAGIFGCNYIAYPGMPRNLMSEVVPKRIGHFQVAAVLKSSQNA
jgi:hypothetical protein